jgi:hypothetical protein
VHKLFANRPLRRRVIALIAAYAIALSGLLASFGTARAAAESPALPGGILCHSEAAGAPALPADQGNSKNCTEDCCIGCQMPMASLPPPPTMAVAVSRTAGEVLRPLAVAVLPGAPETRSYRSRAPPYGV